MGCAMLFCLVFFSGFAQSLYQKCTLNQQNGANFCRQESDSFLQTTVASISTCAALCESFNSDSYVLPSDFPSYYSTIIFPHTSFTISSPLTNQIRPLTLSWGLFHLHLQAYPFFPFLTNPPHHCQAFNFISPTNTCHLFHPHQDPPMLLNISQCSYLLKLPFGSCLLNIYHDDCHNVPGSNSQDNGVYWFRVGGLVLPKYCVFTGAHKYTVILRRVSNEVVFDRGWQDYKEGFGDVTNDFYVGNQEFHALTQTRNYTLRIHFEKYDGTSRYQDYEGIDIADEASKYALTFTSTFGTAGDGLYQQKFSTRDQDNDFYASVNCASFYSSGWWYRACHLGVMTGPICTLDDIRPGYCMCWHRWGGFSANLRSSMMMLRRA